MVHVLLSGAMSIDGFIDDASPERLRLSGPEDFAAIDELRASCDAILVGAGTLRADNPKLTLRNRQLSEARIHAGKPPDPAKVTLTHGRLDPHLKFFGEGESTKFVYCPADLAPKIRMGLSSSATVVACPGTSVGLEYLLQDLFARGVKRLLVEGGSHVSTQFLSEDRVDEMRLAIGPFFVGQATAPRFVKPANFPAGPARRLSLEKVEKVGDMAVMNYRVRRNEK